MTQPTLCMIFEATGPYSAIGKVAMTDVQIALDAGYKVSVVAKFLDESLRSEVEWIKLYVPPRGFAVQWLTGRHFIRKALGGRRFDIVHGHQPQIADLCDVFQCHFLTRSAYESHCLDGRKSLRGRLARVQEQVVLYAEDRHYRKWNPQTRMFFVSELLRREFDRIYGEPPLTDVLPCPCPPYESISEEARRQAKRKLLGRDDSRTVVGFLGGISRRKGYQRLLAALENEPEFLLLMGGMHTENFRSPAFGDRLIPLGLVKDLDTFYAACDVFIVPSLFEPLGLVAFEAAAKGVPVIASEEVGALPHLLEHGAAIAWNSRQSLAPLLRQATARKAALNDGAKRLVDHLGRQAYGRKLLDVYRQVLAEKPRKNHA
jgi:glycosyltransferase involved in cell wall biosynthesis